MIVRLLLFAGAREAAGTGNDEFDLDEGTPLDALLAQAVARYGERFSAVLATARVWVNGDEPGAGPASPLCAGDEVAVLPPVSGGADETGARGSGARFDSPVWRPDAYGRR